MSKDHEIKKKHHYVSRAHLRYWSNDDTNIFYTTSKKKVAYDSIAGLAMEKFFYNISYIDNRDMDFIYELCISRSSQPLRATNLKLLEDFQLITLPLSFKKNIKEKDKKFLELLEHNPLENLYGEHEKEIFQIQKNLNLGNLKSLNNENRILFNSYLGHQIIKTKTIKEKVQETLNKHKKIHFNGASTSYLIKKNWWIICYLLGNNLGYNLCTRDYITTLLKNNTSIPFLTSDRAVFNIHSSSEKTDIFTPPSGLTYYFPISPNLAVHMGTDEALTGGELEIDEKAVAELNNSVIHNSFNHLFSSEEGQLKDAISTHIRHTEHLKTI